MNGTSKTRKPDANEHEKLQMESIGHVVIPQKAETEDLAKEAGKGAEAEMQKAQQIGGEIGELGGQALRDAEAGIEEAQRISLLQSLELGITILAEDGKQIKETTGNSSVLEFAKKAKDAYEAESYLLCAKYLAYGEASAYAEMGFIEKGSALEKIKEESGEMLENPALMEKPENLELLARAQLEMRLYTADQAATRIEAGIGDRAFGKNEQKFVREQLNKARLEYIDAREKLAEGKTREAAEDAEKCTGRVNALQGYLSALGEATAMLPANRRIRANVEIRGEKREVSMGTLVDHGLEEMRNAVEAGDAQSAQSILGTVQHYRVYSEIQKFHKSSAGYAGKVGKRLEVVGDAAEQFMQQGRFKEALGVLNIGYNYKATFEKSTYKGFADSGETLLEAEQRIRKDGKVKISEDYLAQARRSLGRAIDSLDPEAVAAKESEGKKALDLGKELQSASRNSALAMGMGTALEGAKRIRHDAVANLLPGSTEEDVEKTASSELPETEKRLRKMEKIALGGGKPEEFGEASVAFSYMLNEEREGYISRLDRPHVLAAYELGQESLETLEEQAAEESRGLADAAETIRHLAEGREEVQENAATVAGNLREGSGAAGEISKRAGEELKREKREEAGYSFNQEEGRGREISAQRETAEVDSMRAALSRQQEILEDASVVSQRTSGLGLVAQHTLQSLAVYRSMNPSTFRGIDMGREMGKSRSRAAIARYADAASALGNFGASKTQTRKDLKSARDSLKDGLNEEAQAVALMTGDIVGHEYGEHVRGRIEGIYVGPRIAQFDISTGRREAKKGEAERIRKQIAGSSIVEQQVLAGSHAFVGNEGVRIWEMVKNTEKIGDVKTGGMDQKIALSEIRTASDELDFSRQQAATIEGGIHFLKAFIPVVGQAFIATDVLQGAALEVEMGEGLSAGTVGMGALILVPYVGKGAQLFRATTGIQRAINFTHTGLILGMTGHGIHGGYEAYKEGNFGAAILSAAQTLPMALHGGAGMPKLNRILNANLGASFALLGAGMAKGASATRAARATPKAPRPAPEPIVIEGKVRASAEKKIGAPALEMRTNALKRTFRGIEDIGREVIEKNPELLTQPQAEFEANIRRFRQTRVDLRKIRARVEERGLKVPEEMEADARPYLDPVFRENLRLGVLRIEAERMGVTEAPKAREATVEKPTAPAKAKEYATRMERLDAEFMERHSLEWAEKTVGENPPVIGETAEAQRLRYLAFNRIAKEPAEVRARMKERMLGDTPAKLRDTVEIEWKIYVEGSIPGQNQYSPVREIPGFTAIKSDKLAPEVKADVDGFIRTADGANAHGIASDKGGHERFTDVVLRGEIHEGAWVGPMKKGKGVDRSTSSAYHGPFWVVLEGKAGAGKGPITAEQHIAYVCPSEAHLAATSRAVKNAYSQGMLTRAEAVEVLSKLITAGEAKNAPSNAFKSSKGWAAESREFWAERKAVAEAEVASFERFSGMRREAAAIPEKNIVERMRELRAEEKTTGIRSAELAKLRRQVAENPELKEAVAEYGRTERLMKRAETAERQMGAIGDIKGIKEEKIAEAEAEKAKAEAQLAEAETAAKPVEETAGQKRAGKFRRAVEWFRELGKKRREKPETVMTPEGKRTEVPQELSADLTRRVQETLFRSAVADSGMRKAIGLSRGRGLAESAWNSVFRGEAEPAFKTQLERDAYVAMKGQAETRFRQVAEYAWADVVAERTRVPKRKRELHKINNAEMAVYLRMKKVFGTIWEANVKRKGVGKKGVRALVDPGQVAVDYRGYFQIGVGMPKEMLARVREMGVETTITYDGKNVTSVKDPSAQVVFGDLHGDQVSPVTALKQAGFIIDARPDLPISDTSVAPKDRYIRNPEIAQGTQFIFLGDYIDRGTRSTYTIDFVQWFRSEVEGLGNGSHVHTLRGNHEAIFMRVYAKYRGRSTAEVQALIENVENYHKYSNAGEGTNAAREYERKPLSELREEGIALENLGMETTLRDILGRYGTWEKAVVEMEKPGGMVEFIRGTKSALILETAEGNSLYTHGGPVVKTAAREADGTPVKTVFGDLMYDEIRSVEMLDRHFSYFFGEAEGKQFGEKLNSWMQNGTPTDPVLRERAAREYKEARYAGDYSERYVGVERGGWKPTEENGHVLENVDTLAKNLDLVSISVGHYRGPRLKVVALLEAGKRGKLEIINNDSSLSEAYAGQWVKWEGGIQYKRAWGVPGEKNLVIRGRKDAPGKTERTPEIDKFEAPVEIENGYSRAWEETEGKKLEAKEAEERTATMTVKVTVPQGSIPKAKTPGKAAKAPEPSGTKSIKAKTLAEMAAEKKAAEKEQEVQDLARLAEKRISEERGEPVMPKRPTKEQAREVAKRAVEKKKAEQREAIAPEEPVKKAYVEMPSKLEGWTDPETGLPWEKLKAGMRGKGVTKKFTVPVEVAGMKGDWVIKIDGITEHGGKDMYWYTVSGWPAEIEYRPGETTGVLTLEKGQSLRAELAKNIQRSFAESGSRKKQGGTADFLSPDIKNISSEIPKITHAMEEVKQAEKKADGAKRKGNEIGLLMGDIEATKKEILDVAEMGRTAAHANLEDVVSRMEKKGFTAIRLDTLPKKERKVIEKQAVDSGAFKEVYLFELTEETGNAILMNGKKIMATNSRVPESVQAIISGDLLIAPKEFLLPPLQKANVGPTGIILDTCYILSLAKSDYPIKESIKRLKESLPEQSEVIITQQVMDELRNFAGNRSRRSEEGNLLLTGEQWKDIFELTADGVPPTISKIKLDTGSGELKAAGDMMEKKSGKKRNRRVSEADLSIKKAVDLFYGLFERIIVKSIDSDISILAGDKAIINP